MIEKIRGDLQYQKYKLKEACKQFEALFIEYMLKSMRKTIPKSTLFERDNAEKIYTAMFDEKVAEKVAEAKGLGIAEMLYRELSRLLPDRTDQKIRR